MFEVILHQYDLSQGMAAQMSQQLVGKYFEGIWHTGICVYNKEFYYGGGISYDRVGQTPFGKPTKQISLGFTEIPEELFMEFLREARQEWSMEKYHVFEHNCNHFTNAAADFLLGDGIPSEIVNQPNEFLATPLGAMLSPMMQGMQDNLKVQSNPVYDNSGAQNEVRAQAPAGIYGGGQGGGAGAGAGAGGMPNMANMANMMGGGGAGGARPPAGGGGGGLPAGLPAGLPPNIANMARGMDPATLQGLMSQFGIGGTPPPTDPTAGDAKVGEVCEVGGLSHLQKLIKESPGLLVDFWSPTCPPCMRIKPVFEGLAKANENPNLVFASVNTSVVRDAPTHFKVTGIPNFIAFHNGAVFKNFKGADEPQLKQTINTLADLVPKGKMVGAHTHEKLEFKVFRPNHLAPVRFDAQTNMDKMKEFISKFVNSETVTKEVGEVANFKAWLPGFQFDNIPQAAIGELIEMVAAAEEKTKIALIDLTRLLMLHEAPAAHILYKHWETFDISIFQYLLCCDITDPKNKVIHNYHLVSLKMLGNIYQTPSGRDFVGEADHSEQVIKFCEYSFKSANPRTVFAAAVLLFSHVLTFKGDFRSINAALQGALSGIIETLPSTTDTEALGAMLLCEIRILYKNADNLTWALASKDKILKVHDALRNKIADDQIKNSIDDLYQLIGGKD